MKTPWYLHALLGFAVGMLVWAVLCWRERRKHAKRP